MLMLGGSPTSLLRTDPPAEFAELYDSAAADVAQVVEALPNSVLGRLCQAADFASHAAVFAACAPRLTTLELTGLGLHLAVSAALVSEPFQQHFDVQQRKQPEVWDFGLLPSLQSAARLLDSPADGADRQQHSLQAAQLRVAFQAATNCSTIGRSTPLHAAAEAGTMLRSSPSQL